MRRMQPLSILIFLASFFSDVVVQAGVGDPEGPEPEQEENTMLHILDGSSNPGDDSDDPLLKDDDDEEEFDWGKALSNEPDEEDWTADARKCHDSQYTLRGTNMLFYMIDEKKDRTLSLIHI